MKSTFRLAIPLAAALVSAQGQDPGEGVPYNCAKPNAQYCLGGDIILRCNESSVGYPGRCSANLSGYPPSGGIASCWQSGEEAGDAACAKNCIVYAEESFTLPADECTPSATTSGSWGNTTLATQTSTPTVITDPILTSSTPIVITDPIRTSSTPVVITDPILSTTYTTIINPIPSDTSTTISDEPTNTPPPPPSLTDTEPPPTGAAVANQAGGALAAVGLVVAYIL